MTHPNTRPVDASLYEIRDWQFDPIRNLKEIPINSESVSKADTLIKKYGVYFCGGGIVLAIGIVMYINHRVEQKKKKNNVKNL